MSASSCRLRKVSCDECGYTIRMARSWKLQGLPVCPCGMRMRPASPADLAFCGLINASDMSASDWTTVCRENGWDDSIVRHGNAAKAFDRRMLESGGINGRSAGKPQCAYTGCGKWTRDGAEFCREHSHSELEAMPF